METSDKIKQTMYDIIGASQAVHQQISYGLLEPIYQEALTLELEWKGYKVECEKEIGLIYKGVALKKKYKADLIVGDILCELKAVSKLLPEHRAQLCNYLRLTKMPYGILINFGDKRLDGERWAYNETSNECYLIDKNLEPLKH